MDKTPRSLCWPEKSSCVTMAAPPAPLGYYSPPPCYLAALVIWRRRSAAPAEPVPPLCWPMSSWTRVPLLCAPPSASEGCPSPP